MAFFNMSPLTRIAAAMSGVGMRPPSKALAGESQTRAGLREEGIAA
jgi:hypothetical protein